MGHSENNHVEMQKPVAFYAPLISGLIVILILLLFISLFNPKPHHDGTHDQPAPTTSQTHAGAAAENHSTGDNH
jgi:L-lactate permease